MWAALGLAGCPEVALGMADPGTHACFTLRTASPHQGDRRALQLPAGVVLLHPDHSGEYSHQQWLEVSGGLALRGCGGGEKELSQRGGR